MNDQAVIYALTQFGGLGVLAIFAYLLLKNLFAQQKDLASIIGNHLRDMLTQAQTNQRLLERLIDRMDRHEDRAQSRHESLRGNPHPGEELRA